ncbi:MAG: ABC transporter ATP-binding protein [Candidatus Bathyarchaeia archaeon]
MGAILEVKNVSKSFGGVEAVKNISLEVKKGSVTGLIGPNGSGKTTLFNIITGFYKPDAGEVMFEGRRIDGLNPDSIYNLGVARTFQNPRLFSSMTTLENLMLSPKGQKGESLLRAPFKRLWIDEELRYGADVKNLITRLGLESLYRTSVADLSGGDLKMVETSKGILGGAKLILLDEPTAGVQYAAGRRVFEYVNALRNTHNITFFVIEHRIDLLFDFADYVYVLNMGQVLSHGKPQEVASDPEVIKAYMGGA